MYIAGVVAGARGGVKWREGNRNETERSETSATERQGPDQRFRQSDQVHLDVPRHRNEEPCLPTLAAKFQAASSLPLAFRPSSPNSHKLQTTRPRQTWDIITSTMAFRSKRPLTSTRNGSMSFQLKGTFPALPFSPPTVSNPRNSYTTPSNIVNGDYCVSSSCSTITLVSSLPILSSDPPSQFKRPNHSEEVANLRLCRKLVSELATKIPTSAHNFCMRRSRAQRKADWDVAVAPLYEEQPARFTDRVSPSFPIVPFFLKLVTAKNAVADWQICRQRQPRPEHKVKVASMKSVKEMVS